MLQIPYLFFCCKNHIEIKWIKRIHYFAGRRFVKNHDTNRLYSRKLFYTACKTVV